MNYWEGARCCCSYWPLFLLCYFHCYFWMLSFFYLSRYLCKWGLINYFKDVSFFLYKYVLIRIYSIIPFCLILLLSILCPAINLTVEMYEDPNRQDAIEICWLILLVKHGQSMFAVFSFIFFFFPISFSPFFFYIFPKKRLKSNIKLHPQIDLMTNQQKSQQNKMSRLFLFLVQNTIDCCLLQKLVSFNLFPKYFRKCFFTEFTKKKYNKKKLNNINWKFIHKN